MRRVKGHSGGKYGSIDDTNDERIPTEENDGGYAARADFFFASEDCDLSNVAFSNRNEIVTIDLSNCDIFFDAPRKGSDAHFKMLQRWR